jgi:hypothetical protein
MKYKLINQLEQILGLTIGYEYIYDKIYNKNEKKFIK